MNKYLVKIAADAEAKKPSTLEVGDHQSRILEKLRALPKGQGLVVAHGMGSGKTTTGLLAAKEVHDTDPEAHVVTITPASLTKNFHKEEEKHGVGIDKNRFSTYSVDAINNKLDEIVAKKPKLIIVDEAHKLRNMDTDRYKAVKHILDKTGAKPLLLTGTPDYNKPSDMRVLVNLAAKGKVLPEDEKEFNDKFIGTRKTSPGFMARVLGVEGGETKFIKNTGELKSALTKHVDFYDGKTHRSEDFPSSHEEEVKVTMSKRQHELYRFLENDLPAPIRWKVRLGLPLNKKESASLNSFSTGVRQVSNSTGPYEKNGKVESPKIQQIVNDHVEALQQDKNFRGIIYSNYLEAGLHPLSEELKKAGIDHAIYDGSLSNKQKEELVTAYNEGKLKTLLVSSSGSEGLNLKGTKMVQTMEPHFNKKKIDQVVARGIRFKSHEHLPEEERHVTVKHYHSVLPKGLWDNITGRHIHSIDEYLKKISGDKAELGDQMKNLVATDAGHYKAAEADQYDWQNPPSVGQVVIDKMSNPARYVGMAQQIAIPGVRGQILAKVEQIVANKALTGETDLLGRKT